MPTHFNQRSGKMDDLQREKSKGLSRWYLKDVLMKRRLIGNKYHTPGFGFAAQLFATMCRFIIKKLGPEEGEALIKEAVEYFGKERGKRIAQTVTSLGKPLSFKNWLIYTDIAGSNFKAEPEIETGELVAKVTECSFHKAAEKWGMEEYSSLYCKYADYAILEGYNPDVKLKLEQRHKTGSGHCLFRYGIRETS
jgi:hypothetical protein